MAGEQVRVVEQGSGQFASVTQLEKREVLDKRTRRVEGDGTEFLEVPGLLKVEAVNAAGADIPLSEVRSYPVNAAGETVQVREPLLAVSQTADGRTVLLRSKLSNNGIWQKGYPVLVTGDWEDASSGDAKSEKAPKGAK